MISTLVILAINAAAILVLFLLTRRTVADRRRSANWNNLHERGKLFNSQLAHLRDVAAKNRGAASLAHPQPRAGKKRRFGAHRTVPKGAAPGDSKIDRSGLTYAALPAHPG